MKLMHKTLAMVLLCGFVLCPTIYAGEEETSVTELKKGQAELRAELDAVKAELKAIRGELKQILAAVKTQKPAQQKRKQRQPDTTVYDIKVTETTPVRGPKNAPVTITAFFDLQCPFCVREAPKIKQVMADYPDDVRFVFKNFPLSFHKQAKPVHAACVLAMQKSNDSFWKMYDKIIAAPKKLDVATIRGYAEELGLDLAKFDEVMADSSKQDALLAADMTEARATKVRGTPTVLINGLKMAKRNLPDYKARIDELLKKK